MKKILVIILFAFVGITTNLQAQLKQYYNVGWDIAMPMGSFSDFVSETSLRGGSFSGNVFVTDALSVGFKFGYNSFHENKDRHTFYPGSGSGLSEGTAITAATYNYMVSAPILIGPYYHFNLGSVEPYIGVGLGVNYITEEILIQDLSSNDSQWAFNMNPEIGLRFPFGQNSPLALLAKVGYNVNFNKFEPWGEKFENLQTLNFGLSLSWTVK